MRKSVKYQIECIKRKRIGQSAPRPLKIVNGLASSVLTDKKIANPTIQHSQAAAQRNRQQVYAVYAKNGKAHILLTISPNDAKSYRVRWFALIQKKPFHMPMRYHWKKKNVLRSCPITLW